MTSPRGPVRKSDSAGVTLVELMIVLVIVAIGIMTLSGVQTRSSSDVYSTGRRTRALAVAQTQIEVARSLGYLGAVPDSGLTDGFNWRTEVDSVDFGLLRARVTVTWAESGTPSSVQLVNLMSAR
jgi:prepilin-type N-terminal cleavage/methylation domain-containing protein